MDYTINVLSAFGPEPLPLFLIVETMARQVATSCGSMKLNTATMNEAKLKRTKMFLSDINSGRLAVCNSDGEIQSLDNGHQAGVG